MDLVPVMPSSPGGGRAAAFMSPRDRTRGVRRRRRQTFLSGRTAVLGMAKITALTGTPGTGKTTVGRLLASRGIAVIDLNALAEEAGARTVYDRVRGTSEVDLEVLGDALLERAAGFTGSVIAEGHLAHHLPCSAIVVLRGHPDRLRERLMARDYPPLKVEENVWAEALGVIVVESLDAGVPVYEIDTTGRLPEEVADLVVEAMEGRGSHPALDWRGWLEAHV